jgi:uncharacterized membrane protein HdeD (DUF308 family)
MTDHTLHSNVGWGWGWLVAFGVILIIVGIMAMANPLAANLLSFALAVGGISVIAVLGAN